MRPASVPCVAPAPWRSNHSFPRPWVSARGSSNGHLCAHVPTRIKSGDTLAHLDGTIFFALRGGLPYILWHDGNTHWLCPLLNRPTGSRRPAGHAPGPRGRTGADLYGSQPDRHHTRPAWSCLSSIGWPARCPTRGRSPTPWWPVG